MYSEQVFRYCVVFIMVIIIKCTYGQQFDNDVQYCLLNSGNVGKCSNIHNCNLTLLVQEGENPATCDSTNDDVVVCCPMETPIPIVIALHINIDKTMKKVADVPMKTEKENKQENRNTVLSKSSQKCEEYSKIKCENVKVTNTIINGKKVENIENYPHMALLGYGDPEKPNNLTWQCGGTLISEQYILTAAHCLLANDRTTPVVAHLGFTNKQNRNQYGYLQTFKIIETIKHPQRVDRMGYADIALLKLDKPVTFTKGVLPACLHEDMNIPTKRAQATGWGDTVAGDNKGSDDLMKVTLSILKHEDCFNLYPKNRRLRNGIQEEQQFCAGEDTKDTCQGDSGGPLQIIAPDYCMHRIIGVTSFGHDCGKQPGVYARVSHYVPWIESVVWP